MDNNSTRNTEAETTLRPGDLIFILSPGDEDKFSHAVVSLGGDGTGSFLRCGARAAVLR